MKKQEPLITVGMLMEKLAAFDESHKLDFSGLDFHRLKQRASDLIQVEFKQMVYRDESGNVVIENVE
jgi:hypothetical protein